MRDVSHDEVMMKHYREDPEYALYLLNDILGDEDQGELEIVLRRMSAVFGDSANPPAFPAGFSPSMNALITTLRSLGLRLSVTQAPLNERPTLEEMTESVERVEKEEAVGV